MRTGEEDDFGSFVVGVQGRLQRTAWLLTGTWEGAEDLVQSSLVRVWRHWTRVAGADSPEAYTRQVMVNTFLSSRRRKWRGEAPEATPKRPPVADPTDLVALRLSVQAALAQLSARQRAVVVLRYFAGCRKILRGLCQASLGAGGCFGDAVVWGWGAEPVAVM